MDETKMAVITLIVTNFTAIAVVIFSFFLNITYTKKLKMNEEKYSTLKSFLNPICSLIKENNNVYTEFGPPTFSQYDPNKRMESGEIWESIKGKIIIKNLQQIRELILVNSHIVEELDLSKTCNELKIHCISFIEYNTNPSEFYQKNKYKKEWLETLNAKRNSVIKEIKK